MNEGEATAYDIDTISNRCRRHKKSSVRLSFTIASVPNFNVFLNKLK
jgi:hypothetical protein